MKYQPFSQIEITNYQGKKPVKCFLSKTEIILGEAVFAFKFNDYNDEKVQYAKKEFAEKEELFLKNYQNYLNNTYSLQQFENKFSLYCIETRKSELMKCFFDFDLGIALLNNPEKFKPLPYYYSEDNLSKEIGKTERDTLLFEVKTDEEKGIIYGYQFLHYVLGYWQKTPFLEKLISRWDDLSDSIKLILSLSDNIIFRQKITQELLPNWDFILEILEKKVLNLDDMITVINWSKTNKNKMPIIEKWLVNYETFHFNNTPTHSFSRFSENGKVNRLLYLFINEVEIISVLYRLIKTKQYPLDLKMSYYNYTKCHFYRAAILHLLINNQFQEAKNWIALMRENVGYYFSGSPKGFINDTEKMMLNYIKLNNDCSTTTI